MIKTFFKDLSENVNKLNRFSSINVKTNCNNYKVRSIRRVDVSNNPVTNTVVLDVWGSTNNGETINLCMSKNLKTDDYTIHFYDGKNKLDFDEKNGGITQRKTSLTTVEKGETLIGINPSYSSFYFPNIEVKLF